MYYDDLMATASCGFTGAQSTLASETSLTGSVNSPATPKGSNDPGLGVSTGVGKTKGRVPAVKKNWVWIFAVIAVILGIWFFWPSSTTA